MREPAPPYAGEGPHALWHVSENGAIDRFAPHVSSTAESLWSSWNDVTRSSLEFSGIRLRNATPDSNR